MSYWDYNHPKAFEGMVIRSPEKPNQVLCPKCKGYGGWHLKKESYGYFDAACSNCNGWGYVDKGSLDEKCLHEWVYVANSGRCLTEYKCKCCEKKTLVDSSD